MIPRPMLVLLALAAPFALAIQFTPIEIHNESDCALLLDGPGRSSAFDYNVNTLRGTLGYRGPNTCITYDAVNQAYINARKRIQVAQPQGPWMAPDVASVGELLLDISIQLAKAYGLTYEDIEKGLPLIDTSKTLIREVCPPYLANVECRPGKYRRYDGLCTNLQHPTWGATNTPFTRLIGPLFADGMTAPRVSVVGQQLPLSRVVSRTMHPDEGFHDHAGTVMVVAWGQFMDHDYTLTGTPLDPLNKNEPEECCDRPAHLKNPYCMEIPIPEDDYFYRLTNVRCMDFVRAFPAVRPGCRLGSRVPFNTLTGVIDGNTVYGVSEKFARHLRTGYNGLLRMNPVFNEYGLKDLLPLKLDIPDEGCTRPNRSMYCFEAGEIRVNEQLVLTCMHTLMARQHNTAARGLAAVNPHWDDETLYQEARRIVIAQIQHITYNEFLPIILGKEVMEKFGLLTQKENYWDGYDPNVNPNVIDAFAAAAFRFGHSLLPTAIERWSKAHKFIASRRLSDLIRQPYDLYRAGVLDEYFMGLMNQVAQAMDDSVTQEVTNHLFKKPGARFGMDLASFNMQRGREFGLPGYMEFRKFCGLPPADNFDDLLGSMPNSTVKRYASIYSHPSDVDLWSGGVSERPLPGSMVGPTFACIIATQFSYSRRGDRFWYELPNQPSSFTPEQLQEIRKTKLSRIICDNTDLIDTIQVYPLVLPDHEINPRVPCKSGILPSLDFSKWADYSGQAAAPNSVPFEKRSEEIRPENSVLSFFAAVSPKDDIYQAVNQAGNRTGLSAADSSPVLPQVVQLMTEAILPRGNLRIAGSVTRDLQRNTEELRREQRGQRTRRSTYGRRRHRRRPSRSQEDDEDDSGEPRPERITVDAESIEAGDDEQRPFEDISEDAPYEYIRVKPRDQYRHAGHARPDDEHDEDAQREPSEQAEEQPEEEPEDPRPRKHRPAFREHEPARPSNGKRYRSGSHPRPRTVVRPASSYSGYREGLRSDDDGDDRRASLRSKSKPYAKEYEPSTHSWRPHKLKYYDEDDSQWVPRTPLYSHYHEDREPSAPPGSRPNYNPAVRPVSPGEYYSRVTDSRGAEPFHANKGSASGFYESTAPPGPPSGGLGYERHPGPPSADLGYERPRGANLEYERPQGDLAYERPPRWSSSYIHDESTRPRPPWEHLSRPHPHGPGPSTAPSTPPAQRPVPVPHRAPWQRLPSHSILQWQTVPPSPPATRLPATTQIHVGASETIPGMPHPYLLDIVKKYPVKIKVMN